MSSGPGPAGTRGRVSSSGPTVDVIVGRCGRAHGLTGEVFVNLVTDSPQLRFATGARLLAAGRELTVETCKLQGQRAIVRFRESTDRSFAESLTGTTLLARVDQGESPAAADEFFDHQLLGLTVVTPAGQPVGRLTRVEHLGFQDQLMVATAAGLRAVPFVAELVPDIDLAAGLITVDPIPGLLSDADDEGTDELAVGAPGETGSEEGR